MIGTPESPASAELKIILRSDSPTGQPEGSPLCLAVTAEIKISSCNEYKMRIKFSIPAGGDHRTQAIAPHLNEYYKNTQK